MAKKDRTGNRKTREQRKQFKVPELGYYLIVTDTEATERCFFTGLHQALPEAVRNKLVIKVVETKNLGRAALILDEYMRLRPGRSIPKRMKRCMESFVWRAMKKRQYK